MTASDASLVTTTPRAGRWRRALASAVGFSLAAAAVIALAPPSQAASTLTPTSVHLGATSVAVSGLGDQAYWDGYASLSILKGNEYLRIAVVPPTGPNESDEKTLAAAALARM